MIFPGTIAIAYSQSNYNAKLHFSSKMLLAVFASFFAECGIAAKHREGVGKKNWIYRLGGLNEPDEKIVR